MKKNTSRKKTAFSLIELSIVLIIIGLLIAGIIGGASLIKSSEIRAVISEARGYHTAFNGFFSQYNAVPGDFNVQISKQTGTDATGNTQTFVGNLFGNGNSALNFCTAGCTNTANTIAGSEAAIAISQLIASGGLDSNTRITLVGGTTASQTPGINFPSSRYASSGWYFDSASVTVNSVPQTQNFAVLTGALTAAGTVDANSLLGGSILAAQNANRISKANVDPSFMIAVERKVDDSSSNTGRVLGVDTTLATCQNGNGYSMTTGSLCVMLYRVDPNS